MVCVFALALGSTGTERVAVTGRLVRLVGQNFCAMQYWPFSKLQLPLSLVQTFHCLPSTVHVASAATLDEDIWDELLGAIELDATLDAGVLTVGFDVVGVGDPPPPPPPPQAVKRNAVQIAPIKKLAELFIVSPSLLSFWVECINWCNRLPWPVYRRWMLSDSRIEF